MERERLKKVDKEKNNVELPAGLTVAEEGIPQSAASWKVGARGQGFGSGEGRPGGECADETLSKPDAVPTMGAKSSRAPKGKRDTEAMPVLRKAQDGGGSRRNCQGGGWNGTGATKGRQGKGQAERSKNRAASL